MFDTMTMTKALGAACGSLLVFLLGGWAAEAIYHPGGGHGDHAEQAYVIPTGDEEEVEVVEEEAPDFTALLASADTGKGERVFNKCKACHKLDDGANGTGPHLFGLVGREKAVVAGFGYSDSLTGMDGAWTADNLNAFLENPKGYAPGTKMSFSGLKKIEDRANLIAYLDTIR